LQELFELEDKPWFPSFLRQQQTEFIGWLVNTFSIYKCVYPAIIEAAGKNHLTITDMGSGAGGPVVTMANSPAFQEVSFFLTDLYPQPHISLPPNCHYVPTPLDARYISPQHKGLITFFNAFHHFSFSDQKQILQENIGAGNAVFIAEVLYPNIQTMLKIVFTTTIGQVILAPFVKPFSWIRIALTWILPINLFTVTFDGIVSVLKSPTKARMQELVHSVPAHRIAKTGIIGPWWARVHFLYIQ
jgi:hypothetical protein